MGKQAFKYVPLCMGIYLVLAAIEIFLLKYLIDLITVKFIYHVIIYNVLLFIANPIATYFIVEKLFKFKSGQVIVNKPIISKEDGEQ